MVVGYPFAVLLIAFAINTLAFDVSSYSAAMPNADIGLILALAAVILCINHTWLMTETELTRIKYKMHATPEEWAANNSSLKNTSDIAKQELARVHNAHRNATENTIHHALLIIPFILGSPTIAAASAWIVGFSIARLGYTYGYLRGKDNLRSLFMTLGLITTYGLASHLIISLIL